MNKSKNEIVKAQPDKEVNMVARKVNAMQFDDQLRVADNLDTIVVLYSLFNRGINVYKTLQAGAMARKNKEAVSNG